MFLLDLMNQSLSTQTSTVLNINELTIVEVVTTEADLKANIVDDATISIGANINLTSAVNINGITGLFFEGNGFRIDAQKKDRCFHITSGFKVTLKNMTITNGYAVMQNLFKLRMYTVMLKIMPFQHHLFNVSIGGPLIYKI